VQAPFAGVWLVKAERRTAAERVTRARSIVTVQIDTGVARNNGSVARSSDRITGPIRRRCTSHRRDPGSHTAPARWRMWASSFGQRTVTACQARQTHRARRVMADRVGDVRPLQSPCPTPCGSANAPSQGRLLRALPPPERRRRPSPPTLAWLSFPITGAAAECAPHRGRSLHHSRVARGLIRPCQTKLPSHLRG
jgi:hypothetical protein